MKHYDPRSVDEAMAIRALLVRHNKGLLRFLLENPERTQHAPFMLHMLRYYTYAYDSSMSIDRELLKVIVADDGVGPALLQAYFAEHPMSNAVLRQCVRALIAGFGDGLDAFVVSLLPALDDELPDAS